MPLLEFPVGSLDLGQRVDGGDRDLELALLDQPGELVEHVRARPGCVALGLDPVLLAGSEVDDVVDPVAAVTELEGQLDATPDGVREGVHPDAGRDPEAICDSIAGGGCDYALARQPGVASL